MRVKDTGRYTTAGMYSINSRLVCGAIGGVVEIINKYGGQCRYVCRR